MAIRYVKASSEGALPELNRMRPDANATGPSAFLYYCIAPQSPFVALCLPLLISVIESRPQTWPPNSEGVLVWL